jgi:hypothetical protein
VLPILLVDFVHLNYYLLVSIHYEDASNLPLVVVVTHLREVLSKHIVVFLKLIHLIQI